MNNNNFETNQKNKVISDRMYEISDNAGEKDPSLGETLSKSAYEFATENYDKGQRILENGEVWNDDIRGCAVEANITANEKLGISKVFFDDAGKLIAGYAERIADSGDSDGKRDAIEIERIVSRMNRPGQIGIDGIENALKYIEGCLKSKSNLEQQMNPQMRREWEEQRRIRDALFEEKQKRLKFMRQNSLEKEKIISGRAETIRNLSNMYANAGIEDQVPSRQQFQRKVSRMSEEELFFLDAELRKMAASFSRTGDKKELDAKLTNLLFRDFTKKASETMQAQKDQEDIEKLRENLGTEGGKKEAEIPEDDAGLVRFFKHNFRKISVAGVAEFKEGFTAEVEKKYNRYVEKYVENLIKGKRVGVTYPDTVVGVFGNNADMLQRIIAVKTGRIIDQNEILKMSFSEVARRYLDVKLPGNYKEHFRSVQ